MMLATTALIAVLGESFDQVFAVKRGKLTRLANSWAVRSARIDGVQ